MHTPTPDEIAGMAWWNLLPEHDRRRWMSRAGDTGCAADAWAVFKRDSLSGSDMSEKPNADASALPPAMQAPMMSSHPDPETRAAFNRMYEERAQREAERPSIEAEGRAELGRAVRVARGETGQSCRIAAFLLGCYNGTRFPFDLTDFRGLDHNLFEDCVSVLRMDYQPRQEMHNYFERGGARFEELAQDHGLTDFYRLRLTLEELQGRARS